MAGSLFPWKWQGSSTDEQAMWRVKMGDDAEAFAELVRRWERPIQGLGRRMTGDAQRGEDLAQETFARLFAKRKSYEPSGRFSTFLWRMALNVCYDELRRIKRRGESFLEEEREGLALERQADLELHLQACDECRGKVGRWRGSMARLSDWPESRARSRARWGRSARWAAAAAVGLLLVGFGFGRWSFGVDGVEARLESQFEVRLAEEREAMRGEIRTEAGSLLVKYAADLERRLGQEHEAVVGALNELESEHRVDYASLRKELETVAVYTKAGLERALHQMVQLAGYSEPAAP